MHLTFPYIIPCTSPQFLSMCCLEADVGPSAYIIVWGSDCNNRVAKKAWCLILFVLNVSPHLALVPCENCLLNLGSCCSNAVFWVASWCPWTQMMQSVSSHWKSVISSLRKYCCIDECRLGVPLSGIMCTRHDSCEWTLTCTCGETHVGRRDHQMSDELSKKRQGRVGNKNADVGKPKHETCQKRSDVSRIGHNLFFTTPNSTTS